MINQLIVADIFLKKIFAKLTVKLEFESKALEKQMLTRSKLMGLFLLSDVYNNMLSMYVYDCGCGSNMYLTVIIEVYTYFFMHADTAFPLSN